MNESDRHLNFNFSLEDERNFPFKEALSLHLAIDRFHRALGGHGLYIELEEGEDVKEPESQYEQFEDTPFANTRTVFREDLIPSYIPREDVYSAVKELAKFWRRKDVKRSIDSRFPQGVWGDIFPCMQVLMYLHNERIDDFK